VAVQSTSVLQDAFLKHLSDNQLDVMMFLVNGIRLQGRVERFDNYTVQLVRGTGTQVIYKHAISAIYPAEPIQLTDPTSFG
jgi:host factor-I protein